MALITLLEEDAQKKLRRQNHLPPDYPVEIDFATFDWSKVGLSV